MAVTTQWLLLALILAAPASECARAFRMSRCASGIPCADLAMMQTHTQRIGKGTTAANGENILLNKATFDKIRLKTRILHGCVLLKVIDFYEEVLKERMKLPSNQHMLDEHRDLFHIITNLRKCIYKDEKQCESLYEEAEHMLQGSGPALTAKEAAILQLGKLISAKEKIHDVDIQQRAIDEMQTLHEYVPGKAFRRWQSSK